MPHKPITFDYSSHPIVKVTFHAVPTTDDFKAYLREWDDLLAKGERISFIHHVPKFVDSPSDQRLLQAEWIKKNTGTQAIRAWRRLFFKLAAVRGVSQGNLLVRPTALPLYRYRLARRCFRLVCQ